MHLDGQEQFARSNLAPNSKAVCEIHPTHLYCFQLFMVNSRLKGSQEKKGRR